MKICIHASTRPNIIKQYWLIKECDKRWLDFYILHTGQHYSKDMSDNFFEEFGIEWPIYNLWIQEPDRIKRLSAITIKCQDLFNRDRPDVVIVQGDTDSDYGVALTAKMMWIKLVHNEAGIRSDSDIPEEYNRRMIDQMSDLLLIPTVRDLGRISEEWLMGDYILTGNTVCDCIRDHNNIFSITKVPYYLLTLHRNTNTDNKEVLENIFRQIGWLWCRVIFPMHPRTKKMIEQFWIKIPLNVIIELPVWYATMLMLIKQSMLVITDSGWIQEECCVLGKTCVVLRDSTERPFIGSVLWNWDLQKSIEDLPDFVLVNEFNPLDLDNISAFILDYLQDEF